MKIIEIVVVLVTTLTLSSNACFDISELYGNTENETGFGDTKSYVSDLSLLKMSYSENARLARIRLCGPYYNADGIQGFISDGFTTLPLTPIGNHSFNCVDWDL